MQRHGLGLDPPGMMAHAAARVGDAREIVVELRDRVPPHDGVSRLVLEAEQHLLEPLLVDQALQARPSLRERGGGRRPRVVRVVEVLDHRLSALEHVRVRHVVEPEQQVVRRRLYALECGCYFAWVLAREPRPVPHRPVHADAVAVRSRPLAPRVIVHRLRIRAVVVVRDVRQRLDPQVARVVLVRRPRLHRHLRDGLDDLPAQPVRQTRPVLQNPHLVDLRVPRYPPIRVQIRHGQMRAQPRGVLADVDDGSVPRQRLVEPFPRQDVLAHHGLLPVHAQVEVQNRLPQRREIDQVALLSQILLRDLQLDRRGRLPQVREERRGRLADLEIDRAVLHLDDDVGVELAVEPAEEIHGRVGAVVFPVRLPEVLAVVHESAEHDDDAVGSHGLREEVRALGERAVVCQRAGLALAVRLHEIARHVGDVPVQLVRLVAPPRDHGVVERVEGREPAQGLRRGEVQRDAYSHAPRPHGVRDLAQPGHVLVAQEDRVRVDVVHDDAVDADRGQEPRVLGRSRRVRDRRVRDRRVVLEENRQPRVAALDGAVHVVPLVDPADGSAGIRGVGDLGEVALRKHREVFEGAVQRPALIATQDLNRLALGVEPEAIFLQRRGLGLPTRCREGINRPDDDREALGTLMADIEISA